MQQRKDRVRSPADEALSGRLISATAPAGPSRRVTLALLAALGTLAVVSATSASAAVTHTYLPTVSEATTKGPTNVKGEHERVSSVGAMAGDGGHVWLAERVVKSGVARVDEFDAESGEYLKRQLSEEGGVVFPFLTEGVAVGHATGEEEIYVGAGKEGQGVVAAYGPSNKLQAAWEGTHTANKSFTQSGGESAGVLTGVAVDNSTNLETNGDVYVATFGGSGFPTFNVVDVLKPEAGGKEGEAVGQIAGTCKAPGTSCPGAEVPFSEPHGVAVSGLDGDVLVLDGHRPQCAECQVDVFEPEAGVPGVYKFLFAISGTPNGGAFKQPGPIAADANGNIYVVEKTANVVYEFDHEGNFLGRLAGTPTGHAGALVSFKALQSVGVDPLSHDVFVADFDQEKQEGIVDAFGADVVIPDVEVSEPPEALSPTGATLRGKVNPDAEGQASCEFEYGTSTAYGQHAPCTATVANGSAPVEVKSKAIEGLSPDTTYHYRLDATNKNGTNTGECPADCGQFTTTGPGIAGESVAEVSATSARFRASVNPNNAPTSYYFQYSSASTQSCEEDPGACTDLPAAPGAPLGSGKAPIAVSQHAQGLLADTLYHYRVVAISEVQAGKPQAFFGPDQTFRTQLAGASLKLPDQRKWELVSPPNKQGALLSAIEASGIVQAASGGGAISYFGTRPTEAGVQGYFEAVQVISRRSASGWSSENVSLAHGGAVGTGLGNGSEYRFFSQDLSTAVVEPFGEFSSQAPCVSAPESERTPYIRHNETFCQGRAGLFDPLVNAEDTPPGTKFGGQPNAINGEVGFVGASADVAHVVLSSPAALSEPPKAGESSQIGLYEFSAGAPSSEGLKRISILPDGKLAPGQANLGYQNRIARGAISEDGTRVAWSEFGGHLYVRDMAIGKTVQLDLPEGKCLAEKTCGGGEVAPVFQAASSDGSRVLFTDRQRLLKGAGELPGKADLYECEVAEVEGQLACKLTDLTPVAPGSEEGADVQGVLLGISQDGATVYFVANGALAEGASKGACNGSKPPPGASCNLYVRSREGGSWAPAKLVAVLGGEDWPDWKGELQAGLASMTARSSADGRYLTFMSDRPLTGYDNRDAVSGKPDQEVFLYDGAANGAAGRLACASCDPSGARPEGMEFTKVRRGLVGLEDQGLWSEEQGIAANVPGWTSFTSTQARYQSRYLTDQGRLFFDSSDALVAQDVNHNQDAYEYEPLGVGDCETDSLTFNAAAGGCVNLISSGAAAGESVFIDASQDGNDVFFLTGERLVNEDLDTALDVYDAHVCSAAVSCFSEVESPPACTTADACRAPASPPPSIFGAPASSTFSGAGNLAAVSPSPAAKPKGPTQAQRLAAALKACHKHKHKHKRIACERKARKRYPVKKASTRNSAKGKGHKR